MEPTRNSRRPAGLKTLCAGRHLELVARGDWEYVRRRGICGVVGIVAVTDDARLILVEQYRPPVGTTVIELPAGLAGDAGRTREDLELAARRELLEETGYQADHWRRLFDGLSSAGLSDERITFFHATSLRKTAVGGGADDEHILVHEVPLTGLPDWLARRRGRGGAVDLKVYAALAVAAGLV